MKESTLLKITSLICGTVIAVAAMVLGYDTTIAWTSIVTLFGAHEVLERIKRSR